MQENPSDVSSWSPGMLGTPVSLRMATGEMVHGEIFSYDTNHSNLLVLRQVKGRNVASVRIVQMQYIQDVTVHGPPPPGIETFLMAPSPKTLEEREQAAVADFEKRRYTLGVGVTKEAQDCFDFIHKFHQDCSWTSGNKISVLGVSVDPTAEKTEDVCQGSGPEVQRIRQVIEGFRHRREEKKQAAAAFGSYDPTVVLADASAANGRPNYASPSPAGYPSDQLVSIAFPMPMQSEKLVAAPAPAFFAPAVGATPSMVPSGTATTATVTTQEDVQPLAYGYLPYLPVGISDPVVGGSAAAPAGMTMIPTVPPGEMVMLQPPATVIPTTTEHGGQMLMMVVQPGLGQTPEAAAQAFAAAAAAPQLGRHPGPYYTPLLLTSAPMAAHSIGGLERPATAPISMVPMQASIEMPMHPEVMQSIPLAPPQQQHQNQQQQQQQQQQPQRSISMEQAAVSEESRDFSMQTAYPGSTPLPQTTATSSSVMGDTQTNAPPILSQRQPAVGRAMPSSVAPSQPPGGLATERTFMITNSNDSGIGDNSAVDGNPALEKGSPPPPPPTGKKPSTSVPAASPYIPQGTGQPLSSDYAGQRLHSRPNVPPPPPTVELILDPQSTPPQHQHQQRMMARSSINNMGAGLTTIRPPLGRNTMPLPQVSSGRVSIGSGPSPSEDSNAWGTNQSSHPHHNATAPMPLQSGSQSQYRGGLQAGGGNKLPRNHQRRTGRRRD